MQDESDRRQYSKTELAQVQLDDGTTFYVKVLPLKGEAEVSLHAVSFEEVMQTIEGIGKRLSKAWDTFKPGKASVELGIDFTWGSGKVMAFLIDGSAEASMKITLEWDGESTKSDKQ